MSTPIVGGGHAGVGRRIAEARRELGLTQGELAAHIGVTLRTLDRYERGESDASGALERIVELTERPLSWFVAGDELFIYGAAPGVPAEVGERIAQSRARRGLTRRELAQTVGVSPGQLERFETGAESPADLVDRIAHALGEPLAWLETGDPTARAEGDQDPANRTEEPEGEGEDATDARASGETAPSTNAALPAPPLRIAHEDLPRKALGYQPKATADLFDQVADTYRHLWEERAKLEERLVALQAELEVEQQEHGEAAEQARQLGEQVYLLTANEKALADQLEQTRLQLDELRRRESELPTRVSQLESLVRSAETRAADAVARLEESEKELERFREQERTLVDAVVWARQAAAELSESAEREAENLVRDAKRRAAELVSEAEREVERLASERQRVETLTSEVQESLSDFLLGTLARLKEGIRGTSVSDEPTGVDEEPHPQSRGSVHPDE